MSIPASDKYPGFTAEIHFGVGKQSLSDAPRRIMCVGYGDGSTATANTPYGPHASADDVATQHGGGTMLHLMAAAVFEEFEGATVLTCEYAQDAGGTANAYKFAATNTATAAGNVTFAFNGRTLIVPIGGTNTVAQTATAVKAAVDANTLTLPVTAATTATPGEVIFTMKWKGLSSKQQTCRMVADASITGQTYALTSNATGATDGDPTGALDGLGDQDYDYIVSGIDHNASGTGLGTFMQRINTRANPLPGLRGCLLAGFTGTYSNFITLTTALNYHRCQVVWDRGSDMFAGEIAAKEAAYRASMEQDAPVVNMVLHGFNVWRGPVLQSNRASRNEARLALDNGGTTVRYNRQGAPFVVRPITTRCQDANGGPDYRTLDVTKVNMMDWAADDMAMDFPVRFKGYLLQPDDGGPLGPLVANPSLIKGWIMSFLKEYASNGWVKNLASSEALTKVTIQGARASAKVYIEPSDIFAQLDADLNQG